MKYFTPELYLRLQDVRSDETMDAADAAWEQAAQRYRRLVKRILPELPKGLRLLQETFYLHDAEVLSMGREGPLFVMVLRLDVPPRELLVLQYQLTEEATLNTTAFPSRSSSGPVQWMYDEVGLVRGPNGGATHSILLSNGWEVGLRLSGLEVIRVQTVYPAPGTVLIPVTTPPVPRSA